MSYQKNDTVYNIETLKSRFLQALPGVRSQKKMMPSFRIASPQKSPPSLSAVLVCLFLRDNTLYSIYTERAVQENDIHSGQISFPGGRFEENDSDLSYTARRECFEEIGLNISGNNIIGQLTELYIPASNFSVSPFVAFLDTPPQTYTTQEAEVARVLEVPLNTIFQKKSQKIKDFTNNTGQHIHVPYYDWKNHHIWGATAMITAELLDVIF